MYKKVKYVTCHRSPVACHLSPVTCHLRNQPHTIFNRNILMMKSFNLKVMSSKIVLPSPKSHFHFTELSLQKL